jgi:hypothetical protein
MAEKKNIERGELREFGLITGTLFAVLFGFLFPFLRNRAYVAWPWVIFAALSATAILRPIALLPVYRVWNVLGLALGWINSRVVLVIVFYCVVAPLGLLGQLLGRDPMTRELDREAASYREVSRRTPREGIERPY